MNSFLKDRRKLKNYLIRKDIQLKFICINLLFMFLITFVTIFVILFPLIALMYQTDNLETQYQAAKSFVVIFKDLPIALGLVFILFLMQQLLTTHQLCGPLVNFAETFEKIAEGDLTRKVKLRRYDLLNEEKQHINEMIDTLTRTIGSIKEEHHKLLSVLNEVKIETTGSGEQQKSREALKAAVKQAQIVNEHLSAFKLSNPDEEKPTG